jgi:hypothetical protein
MDSLNFYFRLMMEDSQKGGNWCYNIFQQIVLGCGEGQMIISDLAGTGTTIFSRGLFCTISLSGNFHYRVLAQSKHNLNFDALHYFPGNCF